MRSFYPTMPWIREASGTAWSLQHLHPQPSSSSPSQAFQTEWLCILLTLVTETPRYTAETAPLTSAQTKQGAALSSADMALTQGTGGSCWGSYFHPGHGKSLSTQAVSHRRKSMKEKKHSVKGWKLRTKHKVPLPHPLTKAPVCQGRRHGACRHSVVQLHAEAPLSGGILGAR